MKNDLPEVAALAGAAARSTPRLSARAVSVVGDTRRASESAAQSHARQSRRARRRDERRLRQSRETGSAARRIPAGEGRDRRRAETRQALDESAAPQHQQMAAAGAREGRAAAARRGRHHRAVELSGAARRRAARQRVDRRQSRDHQNVRTDAAHLGAVRAVDRPDLRARSRRGRERRRRARRRVQRAALRPPAVHRLDQGRPRSDARRRRASDAGHARTGRQVAGHHRRARALRQRGGQPHRRQDAQRGANLRRAGLRAGAARQGAGVRRTGARADGEDVPELRQQSGLHLDHFGAPLRAPRPSRRRSPGRRRATARAHRQFARCDKPPLTR